MLSGCLTHLWRRDGKWLGLAAALLMVCGCAKIPKAQLNAYVSTVGEAEQAGRTVLSDWRSARAEFERRESVNKSEGASTAPFPLERPIPPAGQALLSAEDTRELAWEAIAEYTTVLAKLNAGESVGEVKQTAGRLFDLAVRLAGGAFPGGGAAAELLKEFAGKIEEARLAKEFKTAVQAGAPILKRIISDVLLADIQDHYRLRASLASEDFAAIELDESLDDEGKALKRIRIQDETKAFTATLDAYEALLRKTYATLTAMEQSMNRPIDFAEEANRLLDIAMSLKQQFEAYQNARREARG